MIVHSIIATASASDATSWPDVAMYAIGIICLASIFLGRWPWQKD